MTSPTHRETIRLASALAEFDPQFLASLNKSLEAWIGKKTKAATALEWMEPFCRKGHAEHLRGLLAILPQQKLLAFANKLDKFHTSLNAFSADQMIDHIVRISNGEIEPTPRPKAASKNKVPKKAEQNSIPKLSLQEILKLDDDRRMVELSRLTDSELKEQVKDIGMYIPSNLKKAQRIQFIQDELAAGWPKPRSILDSSRY